MRTWWVLLMFVVACHRALAPADDAAVVARADAAAVAPTPVWEPGARQEAIVAGQAVISHQQCTRCHEIDGLAGAGRPYDCVSCHVFLTGLTPDSPTYKSLAAKHGQDIIERYQRNIVHLRRVPSLTQVARRLRPAWIEGFVQAPFDVRPMLDESMLRNPITPADARTIARYFAAVADVADVRADEPAPPPAAVAPARVAQGRAMFERTGCPVCHTVGNEQFASSSVATLRATLATSQVAPNLRFAAARLRPEVFVAWIVDPPSVWPGATMPTFGLSTADAELIRDYLVAGSFAPAPAPPAEPLLAMPPPATHPVGWEEVKARVLGKVCVHCHMNDHEKDVGPGNLGGLGFVGRGLAMRTYEMLVRGAHSPDGKRYSVLQALPGEPWPRILDVMVRRRVENLRDLLGPFADHARPDYPAGALGMPMGLPAMTDEELGILRRWIDDGCPGPTAVTGKPGFTDGLLVPDGPIAKNSGCGQREPAKKRPAWATAVDPTAPVAPPAAPAKPVKPAITGAPPR